jgi:anti-sigma regulatory factor (Ser/Thr protein kinase)
MVDVDDEVRLLIPAEPGFLRLARLTAAAVASRMGFTFDEVEDLRIAVDELCYFLLAGRSSAGTITIVCAIHQDGLAVTGEGRWPPQSPPGPEPSPELPELSRRILESVVDEYESNGAGDQPGFRLLKRRSDG